MRKLREFEKKEEIVALYLDLFVHDTPFALKCSYSLEIGYPTYNELQVTIYKAITDHLFNSIEFGIAVPTSFNWMTKLLVVNYDFKNDTEPSKYLNFELIIKQKMKELPISTYFEISKGGKGFHLWIFFQEPQSVYDAKIFGFNFLKKHGLLDVAGFESIVLSTNNASIGALIHLPYDAFCIDNQYTCFIDKEFNPIIDIYDYHKFLKSIKKIPNSIIEQYIR